MSALTNLSPSVEVNLIDLSNFVSAGGMSAGAFVFDASWGYANTITTISDANMLTEYFHKPTDKNYVGWFSAYNFLSYTGQLNLVRVIDADARTATDLASANLVIENPKILTKFDGVVAGARFAARCPGKLGNSISVHVCDYNTWEGWDENYKNLFDNRPGTSDLAEAAGSKNDEMHILVLDKNGQITGKPGTVLEKYAFVSKSKDSKDGNSIINFYKTKINGNSKYIYALDMPTTTSFATASTVKSFTITDAGSMYSKPEVTITGDGTGAKAKVTMGTGADAGKIVKVEVLSGGQGYTNATITITDPTGTGFTADAVLEALPTDDWGSGFLKTDGTPYQFAYLKETIDLPLIEGADSTKVEAAELIKGWELFTNSEQTDVSLLFLGDGGGENSVKDVARYVIDNICDKREDCQVCVSPPLSAVLNKGVSEACTNVIDFYNSIGRSSNFSFYDCNWGTIYDIYNRTERWIPCNSGVAGLTARVDNKFNSWLSPAGLNRGKLANFSSLAWNPDKASRDRMYKLSINAIMLKLGVGFVLFGDRTSLQKDSYFRIFPVMRLFILLKKTLGKSAEYVLFESNNDYTRSKFIRTVEPFLQTIKSRGGIDEFRVVCDRSNNTDEVVRRQEFVASIAIRPVTSINFVTLNLIATESVTNFQITTG